MKHFLKTLILPVLLIFVVLISGCVNTIDENSVIHSITSQYQQVSNFENCDKFINDGSHHLIGGPEAFDLINKSDLIFRSRYECGSISDKDEFAPITIKWESSAIIVAKEKDNYYFDFVKGRGDCQSGCIMTKGYLFKVDNSGNITFLGSGNITVWKK